MPFLFGGEEERGTQQTCAGTVKVNGLSGIRSADNNLASCHVLGTGGINTLATEPLHANSTGLHYTTFNIIMQYTNSEHTTAPSVCWYVY